jgi:hypothetical protein
MVMIKALHIKQWDSLYETAETRKIRKLTFYAKPNKLVGLGINRTRQHERGLEFLGVWNLMVDLASQSEQGQRGWFIRNGEALTAQEIAYLISIPQEPVEGAIKHFLTKGIAWLEDGEFNLHSPTENPKFGKGWEIAGRLPGDSPTENPKFGKGREIAGTISLRGRIDREEGQTNTERERRNGGFASKEEGRRAQTQQFAGAQARIKALDGIAEDERTDEEALDLKKNRALVTAIQKKQGRGDFTPVVNHE